MRNSDIRIMPFVGTLIAAMIISLIATKGVEDLSNFTSFSDFKWGVLGRYIAILAAALFFTHWVAAMLFAKYSFHCPLCTKIIYTQGDWFCPYCDKRNRQYTFLYKCQRCKTSSPAHRCPHCKGIIQLNFKAGTRVFSRFTNDDDEPLIPRDEEKRTDH